MPILVLFIVCGWLTAFAGEACYYFKDKKVCLDTHADLVVVDDVKAAVSLVPGSEPLVSLQQGAVLKLKASDTQKTQILLAKRGISAWPVVSYSGGVFMPLTGEIGMMFKPEIQKKDQEQILAAHRLSIVEAKNDWPLYVIARGLTGNDLFATARSLVESGVVQWAQPVWLEKNTLHGKTPNDPYFPDQWHHTVIQSPDAWALETGSPDSIIAVVDSGVDTTHPDLYTHLKLGKSFVPTEQYVDPNMNGTLMDPNPYIMAHGTCVSGLAAGTGDNNMGIAGVCWNCSILPVKYIGNEIGMLPANRKLDALKWAVDNGAWVINNSWSASNDKDQSGKCIAVAPDNFMAQAIEYGKSAGRGGKGTIMVWSSGNSTCDTALNQTLATEDIIVVSALRQDNSITSYSNYGSAIDIGAPAAGDDDKNPIALATTDATKKDKGFNPVYAQNGFADFPDQSYTKYFNGTSAAAPVVAGAVGLMLSAAPYLTLAEAIACVKKSASTPDKSCPFGDAKACYGAGILNVAKMVENAKSGACGGTPECTKPEDCPGGTCENGHCIYADADPAKDDTSLPQNDETTTNDDMSQDTSVQQDSAAAGDNSGSGNDTASGNDSELAPDTIIIEDESACGCSMVG